MMIRRYWKKALCVAVAAFLLLVIVAWVSKANRDAHYFDNYDPAAPLNVSIAGPDEANRNPECEITKFSFDGYHGESVPALISLPVKRTEKPLPIVIFLHGIGQNKKFLREIAAPFNQCGFAIVTFDQYMQGDRKLPKKSPITGYLKAFGARPAKTVNETRRLVDYLVTRPDIDKKRIYLLGASYGAVTGSTVLAKEKRIWAGVLTYGGGDFDLLLDSYANHLGIAALLRLIDGKNLDPEKPPLPKLTTMQECIVWPFIKTIRTSARYFMGAADPIRYVADISPTPVYFQNGEHDVMVPAAAGKALQDAAGEPKKITWYDTDHVGINIDDTRRVLADALRWLLDQDDSFRSADEKVTDLPLFEMKKD